MVGGVGDADAEAHVHRLLPRVQGDPPPHHFLRYSVGSGGWEWGPITHNNTTLRDANKQV